MDYRVDVGPDAPSHYTCPLWLKTRPQARQLCWASDYAAHVKPGDELFIWDGETWARATPSTLANHLNSVGVMQVAVKCFIDEVMNPPIFTSMPPLEVRKDREALADPDWSGRVDSVQVKDCPAIFPAIEAVSHTASLRGCCEKLIK